ncbi:hypothetical protein D0T87_12910 [Bacteroides sp. 51]|nr:hypothetical protein [Bacteroides sp. 51]
MFVACQKDDIIEDKNLVDIPEPVHVTPEGYLHFDSQSIFTDYLNNFKEDASPSTRSNYFTVTGFNSINKVKSNIQRMYATRALDEDDEEGCEDEYKVSLCEELIPDDILFNVLDTTLRISIDDNYYKITDKGTFYTKREYSSQLAQKIENFNPKTASLIDGDTYQIDDITYFCDTYGFISGVPNVTDVECIEADDVPMTRAVFGDANTNTREYSLSTYKWKNKTWLGRAWSWLFGKDVSREQKFDSKHKMVANLFQTNYVFYASTGFKVKMQKRKKFLFVKYWTGDTADDIVIGIEKLKGQMSFNNNPGKVGDYGKFTSTWQGQVNNMIYAGMGSPIFLEDFASKIKTWFGGIKEFNVGQWKIDPWKWTDNTLTKDAIFSGLKSLEGKYISGPIGQKITNTDPRLIYVFGKSGKLDSYIMGLQSYGRREHKTVRFSEAGGITVSIGGSGSSGVSVDGYIPDKYTIKDAEIFGAVKYGGKWKGIRFHHED